MQNIAILRTGQPPIQFFGEVIAEAAEEVESGQNVATVYETEDGDFVASVAREDGETLESSEPLPLEEAIFWIADHTSRNLGFRISCQLKSYFSNEVAEEIARIIFDEDVEPERFIIETDELPFSFSGWEIARTENGDGDQLIIYRVALRSEEDNPLYVAAVVLDGLKANLAAFTSLGSLADWVVSHAPISLVDETLAKL